MAAIYHKGLQTDDTALMSALTAVGIELDWRKPCEEFRCPDRGRYVTFYFAPSSADGKMITGELIEAWSDDRWHETHPEHPFAYIKMAKMNEKRGLDLVKSRAPIALIQKGSKMGFLSLNASRKTEDLILGELHI